MISIRQFVTSKVDTNTFVCHNEKTLEGFVLDIGECTKEILDYIASKNIEIKYVILTHGHFDHIGGVSEFLEKHPNALVIMNKKDIPLINTKDNLAYTYGESIKPFKVDIEVENIANMEICGIKTKFMETPGHTKGSMVVMMGDYMFSGDTLFYHGFGAVDFPTGSMKDMLKSLYTLFHKLDKNYKVFPGHGNSTTIQHEKEFSPFRNVAP